MERGPCVQAPLGLEDSKDSKGSEGKVLRIDRPHGPEGS